MCDYDEPQIDFMSIRRTMMSYKEDERRTMNENATETYKRLDLRRIIGNKVEKLKGPMKLSEIKQLLGDGFTVAIDNNDNLYVCETRRAEYPLYTEVEFLTNKYSLIKQTDGSYIVDYDNVKKMSKQIIQTQIIKDITIR